MNFDDRSIDDMLREDDSAGGIQHPDEDIDFDQSEKASKAKDEKRDTPHAETENSFKSSETDDERFDGDLGDLVDSEPTPEQDEEEMWEGIKCSEEQIDFLLEKGAHLLRVRKNDEEIDGKIKKRKTPVGKWDKECQPRNQLLSHDGPLGIVPASLGISVLDIDVRHPSQAVLDYLQGLDGYLGLQESLSKGQHFLYRTDGLAAKNAMWRYKNAYGDVRGGNGYIIIWQPHVWIKLLKKKDAVQNGYRAFESFIADNQCVKSDLPPHRKIDKDWEIDEALVVENRNGRMCQLVGHYRSTCNKELFYDLVEPVLRDEWKRSHPEDGHEIDEYEAILARYAVGNDGWGTEIQDAPTTRATVTEQQEAEAEIEDADLPTNAYDCGVWVAKIDETAEGWHRYQNSTKTWYKATKTHWQTLEWEDVRARLCNRWKNHLGGILHDAAMGAGTAAAKMLRKHASMVQNSWFHQTAFVDGFKMGLGDDTFFDTKPPLNQIPCANGIVTVTAEGAKIELFDPYKHRHKAVIPTKYNPDADDGWEQLMRVWLPDAEMYDYTHRMLGLILIGRFHRGYVCLIAGSGTGKSTAIRVFSGALGPLAKSVRKQTYDADAAHNSGLCDLIEHLVRFAMLPEAQSAKISAELLNAGTGADEIESRRAHARGMVNGAIVAVPMLIGEAMPQIWNESSGSQVRLHIVEFSRPPKSDKSVIEKAKAGDYNESFLKWLIDGAIKALAEKWNSEKKPAAMTQKAEDSLSVSDPFMAWVNDNLNLVHDEEPDEVARMYNLTLGDSTALSDEMNARKVGRRLNNYSKDFKTERIAGGKNGKRKTVCVVLDQEKLQEQIENAEAALEADMNYDPTYDALEESTENGIFN